MRAFFSRERAVKVFKSMGGWNNTGSYRVVEYKMAERNMWGEREEDRCPLLWGLLLLACWGRVRPPWLC